MTFVRGLLIALLAANVPAVALVTSAGSATSVVAPPGERTWHRGLAAAQPALDRAHHSEAA